MRKKRGEGVEEPCPCLHGRGAIRVWEPLNAVLALRNVHDGNTGDFANTPLQILVTGGDDVDATPLHSFHKAVISVGTLVGACKPLKSWILGHSKCDFEFVAQLFELPHDTVCNVPRTFCKQAIHHLLVNVQFVTDGKVDEVGVQEDVVGWSKCLIELKEHLGQGFGNVFDHSLFLLALLAFCHFLDSIVLSGVDDPLDGCRPFGAHTPSHLFLSVTSTV